MACQISKCTNCVTLGKLLKSLIFVSIICKIEIKIYNLQDHKDYIALS